MSDGELEGLISLVTGATSGIGRAVAEEFGRQGSYVIVHGRDAQRGEEVIDAIVRGGGRAAYFGADLTDLSELNHLVGKVGDLDVLVNNAGLAWYGPTDTLPSSTFDELFAANVRAPYYLVAAIAPKMASRRGGSIINIGSRAGRIGRSGGAAYSATKAALASLTRTWAAEYSFSGVRVNTVAPGPVITEAVPASVSGPLAEATTNLKRPALPRDIAPLVAFLASPRASYITGALYAVDGGSGA